MTKRSFFAAIGVVLILIGLIILSSQLIITDSHRKFKEIKQKCFLKGNRVVLNFELAKDTHLLRIKHKTIENQNRQIFLNGIKITANTFHYKRLRRGNETTYIYLPKEIVKHGKNILNITFSENLSSEISFVFRNYRKKIGDATYILFSNSENLSGNNTTYQVKFFTGISFLLLGLVFYFLSANVLAKRKERFFYRHKYLFLTLSSLFLLFLEMASTLGYRLMFTPHFLWKSLSVILIIFFIVNRRIISKSSNARFLLKAADGCYLERKSDITSGILLSLLLLFVNILIFWPSFFHLFRHDEWFLFFSSKDATPNFEFILKHIDWQLHLPYDRLVFRPVHHSSLALNRVIFDTNYIGPHILTFGKHLIACFCLWRLMWECKKKWISVLFALLFSVLAISADPVMFPHFDAYIMTTIFTILAIIIFLKIVNNQLPASKGFIITSFILFLNMLTSEIAFLMPLVFFCAYWIVFRDRNEANIRQKDRCIWLVFLLPMLLWGILFSVHLYFAYPDLAMTSQSDNIGLLIPFVNILRTMLVLISGILFPLLDKVSYSDKMYFELTHFALIPLIIFGAICIGYRKKVFRPINNEIILVTILLFCVLMIICFARAEYINNSLKRFALPSHYVYCISALIIFVIYLFFDFNKILLNRTLSLLLPLILIFLIVHHGFKTRQSAIEIQKETLSLKKYFDSVKDFVESHKKEPDFSFKVIDRPPKIKIFPWYHQTCIDGLFNRFINYKTPKYILEYDYGAEILKSNLCNNTEFHNIIESENVDTSAVETDFINSIGIKFKKISYDQESILIGVFEVNQQQWKDVMGYNPSKFMGKDRPVENVSYRMVEQFLRKLNDIEGEDIYRLPTEKEYLYLLVNFYVVAYEDNKNIEKYAWLRDNANQMTHAVGQRDSMFAGIYDLIGNVWEWTGTPIHPDSPANKFEGNPRQSFGGSWRDTKINYENLTTNYPPDFRHEHLGFRLVCEAKDEDKKEK